MPSRNLNLVVIAMLLFTGIARAAEEEAKPAAGAETENKDQKEFGEKKVKLNTLASKIEESEKHFEELVKEKNEAKDQSDKQRLIKELNETANEREKAKADYARLKSELSLRFPNHGVASKRNYQTEGAKPPKDDKGAASLDELLTRTKKLIDKKFAAFTAADKKPSPEVKKEAGEEKEKRLKLEK